VDDRLWELAILDEIALKQMPDASNASFFSPEEVKLTESFLRDGFVIQEAESKTNLDSILRDIASIAARWTK